MTTVVFISSPGHDPFEWREVANYLPPAWAVAAPDLRECATMADVVEEIGHDSSAVSNEPIVLVAEGLGARAAVAFADEKAGRVEGILFSAPRLSSSLRDTLRGAGKSLTGRASGYEQAIKSDIERTYPRAIPHLILHPEKAGRAPEGENVRVIAQASADWFSYAPDAFAANVRQFIDSLEPTGEADRG